MEIVVRPPVLLLWIALGIPAFVALVVLLVARTKPLVHRIAPIVLALAASAFVLVLAYRPARFAWNDAGIVDDGFGSARTIAWGDIREARVVPDYARTEWTLARRTNGIAHEGIRAGGFQLANGVDARVFLVPTEPDAMLIRTANETCLYAPTSFAAFSAAVSAHVPQAQPPP